MEAIPHYSPTCFNNNRRWWEKQNKLNTGLVGPRVLRFHLLLTKSPGQIRPRMYAACAFPDCGRSRLSALMTAPSRRNKARAHRRTGHAHMRLLTLFAGFAAAAAFSSLPPLERTWEEKVIDAWAAEPDCSPETGMCGACGVAATVVELGENGTQPIVRKYSVGAGGGETPFGSDATFEIASVTKLFTTMLLLVLEEEGLLSSEATIGTYLPCAWDAARHAGTAEITFNELVRHTSGLPAQPPDRGPSVGGNPFSGYTEERLCESLGQLTGLPTRGRYSYSNYAYGTLGYVLTLAYAAVTGSPVRDYEDLLKEKVSSDAPRLLHAWYVAVCGPNMSRS
eukprot:6193220-Pleurochrysis_carterae.AAC.1